MLKGALMTVLRVRTDLDYTIIKLFNIKLCEMGMSLPMWGADFVRTHPALEDDWRSLMITETYLVE